ncbi:unnamed protein product [Echinostoma caproni]|uniref:Ubiquitin-like protein ATG12 n=1 Tax=Echinostoma caproni TaxID=27848 RepID=A0A183A1D1_9TREM|nr:unnamed protein product [Echinostoma caproni]
MGGDSQSTAGGSATPSDTVTLLLQAAGNAPQLKKKRWAVQRSKTVAGVVNFLRDYISCAPNESLFLYVNQCFAPSLDTKIGTIYDCYSAEGKLVLHFCKTQAWG